MALIAKNPATGDQVTRYEYGVTLGESDLASNDLLRAEIYPDASDSADRVRYSYNRQGQRVRLHDQNGSVHEYEYDGLGRQTADKVTALGVGVDGAVRRIGQSYEVRGLVEKVTSYSDAGGTAVVNEVQNAYNSFGQLVAQYQEHDGAVNTGTTPKVEYGYEGGSANTVRKTSMTYPSGQVLQYLYDDEAADKLSRVRTLEWHAAEVCQYSYLGLATFVTTDYLQPQVKLDYTLGSGANPYTGFDRFGRVIDLLWENYGADEELVHLKYGYDQASNRTYREDLVAQSYDKDFDELYEYDSLHRLKKFHRGRLTDDNRAITSPTLQQSWELDATGNWENFTQNDQADASQTLDQQRVANRVNEIAAISRTVGDEWVTPEYDRNGNMTLMPQPKAPTLPYRVTWDAWNRMVRLEEPQGEDHWQLVQVNAYDGLGRRIGTDEYVDAASVATRMFHSAAFHEIATKCNAIPVRERLRVWGPKSTCDLIAAVFPTTDSTHFVACDAIGSDCAAVSLTSETICRFCYTPYGAAAQLTPAYIDTSEYPAELWAGLRYDATTGLLRGVARSFNNRLGRWVSCDPLRFYDSASLYQYTKSNPLLYIDPSGLQSQDSNDAVVCSCNSAISGFEDAPPEELSDLHNTLTIDPCAAK